MCAVSLRDVSTQPAPAWCGISDLEFVYLHPVFLLLQLLTYLFCLITETPVLFSQSVFSHCCNDYLIF